MVMSFRRDGASLSRAVDAYDRMTLYSVEIDLRFTRKANLPMRQLLAEVPELAQLVGKMRRTIVMPAQTTLLGPEAWERLHHALATMASLAFEGEIEIRCDSWNTVLKAHGTQPRWRANEAA